MRTRVGYSGGTSTEPTYHNLDGHSETVEVDFDPQVLAYTDLLDAFWSSHDALHRSWSRQYASVIFVRSPEQERAAKESREMASRRLGKPVVTEIVPFTAFYLAEAYHQKYWLRQDHRLLAEYLAIYPGLERFIASTAVARVNGYLGGYGTSETLGEELSSYGLSGAGSQRLREIVQNLRG